MKLLERELFTYFTEVFSKYFYLTDFDYADIENVVENVMEILREYDEEASRQMSLFDLDDYHVKRNG